MTPAFSRHVREYDAWFDNHADIYKAELAAVKQLLPAKGVGLEVGSGTGRFAGPLNIGYGVEPSFAMAAMAKDRGVNNVLAVAEALPFAASTFDYVVFITSLCFVSSLAQALNEARCVLRTGGSIVIGLINPDSELGRQYEARKQDSVFYRHARFISIADVNKALAAAGYGRPLCRQTLIPGSGDEYGFDVIPGCDRGGFVVMSTQAA